MKRVLLLMICSISLFKLSAQKPQPTYKQLQDSIIKLNKRPVMTTDQFIKVYKYETLMKYYRICKKNPTQWKYYKGWSIRVFEQ